MLTIITDLHAGVRRSAGTTPATSKALQQYLLDEFENVLVEVATNLCLLGDLVDSYTVDISVVKKLAVILQSWLVKNPNCKLTIVQGNHDKSNNTEKLSSLDMLAWILGISFSNRLQYITSPEYITGTLFYVVPHMPTQDIFDTCISEVPEETKFLLLHCNYNNHFALQSDHSLNLTEKQAQKLLDMDIRLGFGHEHPKRQPHEDVFVFGNLVPSSISDCKGQEKKYYHIIDEDYNVTPHKCWDKDHYIEVDWRVLESATTQHQFVRVSGECSSAESAQVIRTISNFRKKSEAFVVSNAVAVEGLINMDELVNNMEDAKNFDALDVLYGMLKPEQVDKIKEVTA